MSARWRHLSGHGLHAADTLLVDLPPLPLGEARGGHPDVRPGFRFLGAIEPFAVALLDYVSRLLHFDDIAGGYLDLMGCVVYRVRGAGGGQQDYRYSDSRSHDEPRSVAIPQSIAGAGPRATL